MAVYPQAADSASRENPALFVNFFMGGPDDSLAYRVDGGQWIPMQIADEVDPAYVAYLQEWDSLPVKPADIRRPSNPVPCTHLWKAGIDATALPAGRHEIEVRIKDRFGRIFTEKSYTNLTKM